MSIKLSEILKIENPEDYKIHFAIWNGKAEPLDMFVDDKEEWESWSSYKPKANAFNRKYIFAVANFYKEKDTWLFGDVFEVLGVENDNSYKIRKVNNFQEFSGRLKLKFKASRNARQNFENVYDNMEVSEILKEPYTGLSFPGYDSINLSFYELENIIKNEKQDWKAALQNAKGIYLITDKSNGKRYIGSAYGEEGIWSRWCCYVKTGHGHNDGLINLIKEKGKEHTIEHFQFTLLEYHTKKAEDEFIISRESFYKEVLLTRDDKFGYNKN